MSQTKLEELGVRLERVTGPILTASLWCEYECGAANVRDGRKGVDNVCFIVSKDSIQ
jgi:hypothetical protein